MDLLNVVGVSSGARRAERAERVLSGRFRGIVMYGGTIIGG